MKATGGQMQEQGPKVWCFLDRRRRHFAFEKKKRGEY